MRYRLATILILCLASFVLCPSPIRAAAAPTRTDEKGGSFILGPQQAGSAVEGDREGDRQIRRDEHCPPRRLGRFPDDIDQRTYGD